MSDEKLQIRFDGFEDEYRPGDPIEGRVTLRAEEGLTCTSLEIASQWGVRWTLEANISLAGKPDVQIIKPFAVVLTP